jgi:hypothetical protein
MQKPIEGPSVLEVFTTKNMLKNAEGKEANRTIGAYQSKFSLFKEGV